jgi:hypothetical protein
VQLVSAVNLIGFFTTCDCEIQVIDLCVHSPKERKKDRNIAFRLLGESVAFDKSLKVT